MTVHETAITSTFVKAAQEDAQDIFLIEGERPVFRVNGELNKQMTLPIWTSATFDCFIFKMFGATDETKQAGFFEDVLRKLGQAEHNTREGSFTSYDFNSIHGNSNLRCHMYTAHPKGNLRNTRDCQLVMNIRVIPQEIPTIEELNLPDISPIFKREHGLLLISGRSGDGKSTTMAAIVNEFNHQTDKSRIILTIEDPIEFVHTNHNAFIIQKRVGDNVVSYARATEDALREDAHIVVLGELRGEAEMRNAIRLAEVGKLVIATIHSNSVPDTVERYIGEFSGSGSDVKEQVRAQLMANLCGIIHQNLIVHEGEQYPFVSMCLVDSDESEKELRKLTTRESLEQHINNSENPYVLSRRDGFEYLKEIGVLDQEDYDKFFID